MLFTKLITVPVASLILAGIAPGDCYAPLPRLDYKATASKTKYNISESAWALTGFHGGTGGGVVLGLAHAPVYYEYQNQYTLSRQGEHYCVAIDKMKMYYRARPLVYISSEFPRGSCEFDEVVKHENKHVKTLLKFHKKTTKEFRAFVNDTILQARPVKITSPDQAEAAQKNLEQEIQQKIDVYLQDLWERLGHEQTKVDSPSEYERVNKQCDDWEYHLRAD